MEAFEEAVAHFVAMDERLASLRVELLEARPTVAQRARRQQAAETAVTIHMMHLPRQPQVPARTIDELPVYRPVQRWLLIA